MGPTQVPPCPLAYWLHMPTSGDGWGNEGGTVLRAGAAAVMGSPQHAAHVQRCECRTAPGEQADGGT